MNRAQGIDNVTYAICRKNKRQGQRQTFTVLRTKQIQVWVASPYERVNT